jgi:hypothetical protein
VAKRLASRKHISSLLPKTMQEPEEISFEKGNIIETCKI